MSFNTILLIIIILLIILSIKKIEIYYYILVIFCLGIYKYFIDIININKLTLGGKIDNSKIDKSKIDNSKIDKSKIDLLIKKISKNYPYYDEFKKLFLQDISKVNNVLVTIDDIKERLKYDLKNPISRGNHIGQRKLLLSEVQFLTNMYSCNNKVKYCIYAGSAPGNKTYFLSRLFPDIKFILIDPNKFNLFLIDEKKYHREQPHNDIVHIYNEYPSKVNLFMNKKYRDMTEKDKTDVIGFIKKSDYKIFIIEDFMDDKYAELFKQLGETVFISDIRSNTSGSDNESPLDIDIYWNTSMMYNWINILKPELSMLKIRLPFLNEKVPNMKMYEDEFKISKQYNIDFKKDYDDFKFKMCKSVLYLQAWSRHASSETRMYIKKEDINNIIEYDIKEIEEKIFYYNCIVRSWYMNENKNANEKIGFCYCADCALENLIWVNYLKLKINYIKTIDKCIFTTNDITSRPLKKIHNSTVWSDLTKDINNLEKNIKSINKKVYKTVFTNQKGQSGKN
jgi:hypothetical protein